MCFHKYCPYIATYKLQDSFIHIMFSFVEHVLDANSVSGLIVNAGDTEVQAIDGPCPHGAHSLEGKTIK